MRAADPQAMEAHIAHSALLGVGLIVVSLIFLTSDALELARGGLTEESLLLRLVGQLLLAPLVLALCALQQPRNRFGEVGALLLVPASVLLAFASSYGLVSQANSFADLGSALPGLIVVGSAGLVLAAALLAYSAVRAERLPGWAGATLVGGVLVATLGRVFPGPAWFAGALTWEAVVLGAGAGLLLAGLALTHRWEREDVEEDKPGADEDSGREGDAGEQEDAARPAPLRSRRRANREDDHGPARSRRREGRRPRDRDAIRGASD
jgi:hypothetical protein